MQHTYTFISAIQNTNRGKSKNLSQSFKLTVQSITEYFAALTCNFSY